MVINRHEGPSADILKAPSCRKMLSFYLVRKFLPRLSDVGMGQTWENMENGKNVLHGNYFEHEKCDSKSKNETLRVSNFLELNHKNDS